MNTEIVRKSAPAENVIGILPNRDGSPESDAIVIGAHYDHLGRGGQGSLAPREGEIHHGADDNASGVAGLLELARILASRRDTLRRAIVFIAFSGEEVGLLGSNWYVKHPLVPLARTVAMINMDMIGRLREDRLIVGGAGTAREWRTWVEEANRTLPGSDGAANVPENQLATAPVVTAKRMNDLSLTLNEDGYGPSDHSSVYANNVPVLFFFTGAHADYHKPSDTADRVNYKGEARVLELVARVVERIESAEERPAFTVAKAEPNARAATFHVSLGTIPDYAAAGGNIVGVRLEGVRDGSPAARAGIRAGDRITRLAGHEVKNVYDYTYALSEMKAGQEYEIEVVRNGVPLRLKVTPVERK